MPHNCRTLNRQVQSMKSKGRRKNLPYSFNLSSGGRHVCLVRHEMRPHDGSPPPGKSMTGLGVAVKGIMFIPVYSAQTRPRAFSGRVGSLRHQVLRPLVEDSHAHHPKGNWNHVSTFDQIFLHAPFHPTILPHTCIPDPDMHASAATTLQVRIDREAIRTHLSILCLVQAHHLIFSVKTTSEVFMDFLKRGSFRNKSATTKSPGIRGAGPLVIHART